MAGLAVYDRPRQLRADPVGAAPDGPDGLVRVVYVHGAMDRGASFLRAIRLLPELDSVRYDRRGYGRSVDAGVADSIDAHVDDLLAVVDEVPSVVVGHSFGAVVALAGASRRPDVVRSVLAFEPPSPWEDWWPAGSAGGEATAAAGSGGAAAAAERFMRRIVGDATWEGLPEATQAARRREGAALLAELAAMRLLAAPPYSIDRIGGRLVVGHGSATDERHVRAAHDLARAGGVPPQVIEGARHGAHTSHPAEFAALVRRAVVLGSR